MIAMIIVPFICLLFKLSRKKDKRKIKWRVT